MIEKLIAYSIRNPALVVAAALLLAGWGVYSIYHTPIDAIPDLSENQVIVFADWMGRSPREVEDQVTYPLSVNLQGLAGVKAIRATSEFGFSMINIIFEDDIDFYFARQRVLERLSIAETFLPDGVKPYLAPDATALGQIFWYTVEGDGYDIGRLRAIQDWFVRYQLYSVPGVAEVASVGGYPIEYQIDVDPGKLRAYNVTLGELYSAVARSNSAVGGRVVQKGGSEFLIRSVGWIESLRDVENIVVKRVAGTPVYVSNIAAVQYGSAARRTSLEKNGNEAVGGVVLMRYDENPLEVTEAIKDKIGQLQAGLPEGVRIVPFYDRTRLIESAVETVRETLIEEIAVASLAIIFVMRHVRSALIICLTLPLTVLASFVAMRLFHIPSNIMSLAGIAISIGVLVDAAIVMVDQGAHTLHKHFGSAKVQGDTRELLTPALQTVGRPIFFSLLIMVVSFMPVFALGGMEGRMFHPLAFTKTFALVAVAILAITLVPAVIPPLIRGRVRGENENWLVRRVIEIYQPVLNFLMDHPWPIVWITGVILIVGLTPAITGAGFFWTFFRIVAALSMLAAVVAISKEEDAFRRRWWIVATLWAITFLMVAAFLPNAGLTFAADNGGEVRLPRLAFAVVAPLAAVALSWAFGRRRLLGRVTMIGSLFLIAFVADRSMSRLGREFMPPLDEGTILDMPVTIPRASITQVADDLKARDALLRTFPEVELVVGKAGRAETPTDPAPPDMVETVINLLPHDWWPKRELAYEDALEQTAVVLAEMERRGWIEVPGEQERTGLVNDATMHAVGKFDEIMRSHTLQQIAAFRRDLGVQLTRTAVSYIVENLKDADRLSQDPPQDVIDAMVEGLAAEQGDRLASGPDPVTTTQLAQQIVERLVDHKLIDQQADLLVLRRNAIGELVANAQELLGQKRATYFTQFHDRLQSEYEEAWAERVRTLNWELVDMAGPAYTWQAVEFLRSEAKAKGHWKSGEPPRDELQAARRDAEQPFAADLILWRKTKDGLIKEMDTVVQMPGWGNIWTQPIINRVDMLATGVRTMIGVKVYGDDLNEIQAVAENVAQVLKGIRGAVDVFPDQVVGEGYLEIDIDRENAARYGINVGDIQDVVEVALGGQTITTTVEGRERFPVRIRYARDFRLDEESVKQLLVSGSSGAGMASERPAGGDTDLSTPQQVPLASVADVRIVEGPSMIKSENGLLRAYVQLNVRERDIVGFVEEAQRAVAEQVNLPPGMYLEWSGQFEHQVRARRTLSVVFPLVIVLIFLILYITYHDFVDTLLVMGLAVPGAIAGGVLFQFIFGFNFSVAVWVGYIACFGLATENGLVMLVYLREAIEERGGLAKMTLEEVREAVMQGAVHRTRPKLLTELTTMVGLAPMLWATGTGSEIIRPMAAPVLGGILVSDEVVDLLLPVLFYHVRRWRWRRIHGNTRADGRTIPAPRKMEAVAVGL
jgi:Cu(I)/Ag(I) efflux system membrane protein CusA/SilA